MHKTANVSASGYAAFASTLWLASMGPAGWFDQPGVTLAPLLYAQPGNVLLPLLAAVLGGCVLAIAGLGQILRGCTLDAVLFLIFAGYWWVAALSQHAMALAGSATPGFLGWYYIVWAFLVFCLWLAACRNGVARMLFTLGLWLALLMFALAHWTHAGALSVLGGYLGLVTAVVGIYIAAAEVVNEIHGHIVLPLGSAADGSGPPS
ncbi:MAG TPA: acetate uptake transporter [Rhodanobacteraceae bacterium]|jgi:succinate-acetate transporter protein|nr:acetate uptake transporter [Rhodanobacteraceae bacterium]